jgi:NADH:ubiquinone oxidoreductase subunit B-like Fe-S oxidoreductase
MPKPLDPPRPQRAVSGEESLIAEAVVVTRLDRAIGWARKYSIFPYPFATACCAMEFMSLSMSPYDIDRFGALLPRFTPRQADLSDGHRHGHGSPGPDPEARLRSDG